MPMKKVLNTAKKYWMVSLIISLIFSGCSSKENNKKNNENPQAKQQQLGSQTQEDEIPQQLESLENNIEKVILTLDGPAIELKKEKQQNQGKKGSEKEQGEQGTQDRKQSEEKNDKSKENEESEKEESKNKKDENKETQDEGSKEGSTDGKKQPTPTGMEEEKEDPWKEIDKIINTLHYQWNSYLPLAAKKNAGRNLIDGFSTALNSLTDTVISKNKTNTLLAASYLYAYIPDFYSLYRAETSPEIKRVRYYTRNAMLNAMTANWEQADSDMSNLKNVWNLYKNIVPEEQRELSSQLDYSIQEFEKVLSEKNQPLCDIKGRVVMSNIQALEESMK